MPNSEGAGERRASPLGPRGRTPVDPRAAARRFGRARTRVPANDSGWTVQPQCGESRAAAPREDPNDGTAAAHAESGREVVDGRGGTPRRTEPAPRGPDRRVDEGSADSARRPAAGA